MTRAILLIDHGSRRDTANRRLAEVARTLQAQASEGLVVRYAHMELAEPDVAAGFRACVEAGATDIAVQPFMLSTGRHVTEDIPRLVEAAATSHGGITYRIVEPVGSHPLIVDIVLSLCGLEHDRD